MGYLPIKNEIKNKIIKGITSKEVTDNFFTRELFIQDLLAFESLIFASWEEFLNLNLVKLSAACFLE
jgi:hypothetical protein